MAGEAIGEPFAVINADDYYGEGVQVLSRWLTGGCRPDAACLVAYRMQLFLQAKAAGNASIGTANCWGGMDRPAVPSAPAAR